ncbi:MAG TPA: transposon-encoded TnpW family protein [Lachnospiraceae bacterium]|nr:transposon-encoded TnpW family protein [Lachnospiraceae bacterium]
MEEAKIEAKQQHPQPDGSFTMRLGNTTYLIGMHFKKDEKETVTDKIKRLMRKEIKTNSP